MATYHRRQLVALRQALDEARFGAERTLNLRATLPTVADALARAEAWLREKQVEGTAEVLVITGRGNNSPDGISAVREAVRRHLGALRRRGVVESVAEHTPGSFAVRLAPMRALWDSPRRKRGAGIAPSPPAATPPALALLEPETRDRLRVLAMRSLESLGSKRLDGLIEGEMLRQFGVLAAAVPDGPDRERRLRRAIDRAIEEFDDRG